MFKVTATDKAPAAIGPYSQAIAANGILFASGQIGIDPAAGKITSDTIEGQAEQACKNVAEVLKANGLTFDQVIRTTCYLSDMANFKAFNDVYAKYFTSKPARSCVAVKEIPAGALCEIEITAIMD
ncbi:MAG: Rid family detoxifying hydrolase [Eubacterium sp.]|jgi:2-iminobutanoate/2-iminopropanoate deaminase|nr:Rid family detoxifying hydrolase [Eubacterium sp.]MCH4047549.1 Rid family detoxifying hydrolase [Eubacterium sp.]MCH4078320.1 Rid family detoxifying hydrolase [Eubacterium sp.]MCH4109467.1 Rid family detoxifying hydrolase [Eubacterium sp.]MCI1307620.1 Rid family detoxifying hydrolase [Eubacterium sp.]